MENTQSSKYNSSGKSNPRNTLKILFELFVMTVSILGLLPLLLNQLTCIVLVSWHSGENSEFCGFWDTNTAGIILSD